MVLCSLRWGLQSATPLNALLRLECHRILFVSFPCHICLIFISHLPLVSHIPHIWLISSNAVGISLHWQDPVFVNSKNGVNPWALREAIQYQISCFFIKFINGLWPPLPPSFYKTRCEFFETFLRLFCHWIWFLDIQNRFYFIVKRLKIHASEVLFYANFMLPKPSRICKISHHNFL